MSIVPQPEPPPPPRGRFQFRLTTLLASAALAAVLSWSAARRYGDAVDQRAALTRIGELGGIAMFDYQEVRPDDFQLDAKPPIPSWAADGLAEELFRTPVHVDLSGTAIDDETLTLVGRLSALRTLILNDTQIGDAGLRHLTDLGRLRFLYLRGTRTTEAGALGLEQALPGCLVIR